MNFGIQKALGIGLQAGALVTAFNVAAAGAVTAAPVLAVGAAFGIGHIIEHSGD